MKCIIASPVGCYPSPAGNAERVRQVHACLERLGYEVHFVLCPIQAMSPQFNEEAMTQVFGSRFHQLDNQPRPLQEKLIQFKRRYYHRIHKTGWLYDFMFADGYVSKQSCDAFSHLVNRIEPDLIVLIYGFMSPLVKHISANCKVVIDAQDKFSYRNRGIRAAGSEGYWLSLLPYQERYLLSQSDVVLGIQEQESGYFKRLLKGKNTEVVTLDLIVAPDQPETRPNISPVIGFLASGNQHNVNGINRFLDKVWPIITEACPDATLLIAGSVTKHLTTHTPNVELLGWVENLADFYSRCRLIVNPCETGSGLKIKTIEAVSFGIPVVSTPCGVAGVEFLLPTAHIIPLTNKQFSAQCIHLLSDIESAQNTAELSLKRMQKRAEFNLALLKNLISN
ncbi:glycosyltransferase [Alteromonas sp. AMM-1]|uniref:glycosyltransferase n=1 Tax=Alteromonas sp. AMM-1 TaxID=3394233 RepID=UPI0039A4C18A